MNMAQTHGETQGAPTPGNQAACGAGGSQGCSHPPCRKERHFPKSSGTLQKDTEWNDGQEGALWL